MSKPVPVEYGNYYHIFSRGINRCTVFFEERNYPFFLQKYAHYVEPIADTYAYCLLGNHFHTLVRIRTVEEQESCFTLNQLPGSIQPKEPSQHIGNLLNSYANSVYKPFDRTGCLFQHSLGSIAVTPDT